jgi:hypothetical protein
MPVHVKTLSAPFIRTMEPDMPSPPMGEDDDRRLNRAVLVNNPVKTQLNSVFKRKPKT